MKQNILFLALIIISSAIQAQLKTTKVCPPFAVELLMVG